mmetsp:Transcript_45361/g.98655  ORF Transcript_45361/g.98655 Transcript_45361/m.98655 type:complete len:345 (-) Transcript_45361:234-1268(-)
MNLRCRLLFCAALALLVGAEEKQRTQLAERAHSSQSVSSKKALGAAAGVVQADTSGGLRQATAAKHGVLASAESKSEADVAVVPEAEIRHHRKTKEEVEDDEDQWSAFTFTTGVFSGGTVVLASLAAKHCIYPHNEKMEEQLPTRVGGIGCQGGGLPGLLGSGSNLIRQHSHETEPYESVQLFWPRCLVLAIMLLVQSLSSIIVQNFTWLLTTNPSLLYFLTMLVGLGGNAGGQSVVLSVRRLAFGEDVMVGEQIWVGVRLGLVLAPLAYARAEFMSSAHGPVCHTIALAAIVIPVVATLLGTAVPKLFSDWEVDPAHAAPIIQVLMDMIGIIIVCLIGTALLS